MAQPRRIGLIVNPIAGIGGRLAARGSDRFQNIDEACRQGGTPVAQQRAERALVRLRQHAGDVPILTVSGVMGADAALRAGLTPRIVVEAPAQTTSDDTAKAASAMMQHGVDLLLVAGGDGTARDVFAIVGDRVPMIGIPTGVKMHSAAFARSPEAAGETAALAISRDCDARPAEIMDADETQLAAGRPSARLFGYALTPNVPRLLQPAKGARPNGGEAAIDALARALARARPAGRLVVMGPGTTMQMVKRAFGFEGTLLGVDAVLGDAVLARDANSATLEALCAAYPDVSLLVGVIGNQGFVFGRGNQQISPTVIRAAGRNFQIIATREKLTVLPFPELQADTGERDLDRALAGYRRVLTGPGDSMMMRFSAAS